ncbi:hypothetical protein SDC9_59451 [bioreactor metagenome]|uniref:Uncharacterized protein n=1 Tax=bioreactor metagenome TaxID=1076179 RepID=A0A644XA60_9ZZZZ
MIHLKATGVWERDEGVLNMIDAGLRAANRSDVRLLAAKHPAQLANEPLDLLVISPGATGLAGAGLLSCKKALLPGGIGPLARTFGTESAISYGAAPKDTITLSSLEGDKMCAALQRELVTVEGTVVERQELVLPFREGMAPLPFLAAVGALLLLGVPPEEIQ